MLAVATQFGFGWIVGLGFVVLVLVTRKGGE